MPDYAKLYHILFRAQTQAIDILVKAHQEAEELYISSPEPEIRLLDMKKRSGAPLEDDWRRGQAMLFTVEEMELICVFYKGTVTETLETLRLIMPGIEIASKKAAAERAVMKLSEMKPGDTVSLAFGPEE